MPPMLSPRPGALPALLASLLWLLPLTAPAQTPATVPAAVPPTSAGSTSFTGLVYPLHDLTLSVHVAGVVERVHVQVGQSVRAGQLLLSLDARLQGIEQERRRLIASDASEQQTVERRRAALEGLVRDATTLYEQAGTVSRDELTKLRMELDATGGRGEQLREAKKREAAELALAQREQAMRQLVAPIAGVVTMVKPAIGEWAAPGDAVLRLVDASSCELRLHVSQAAARRLRAGQVLPVLLDDPALPMPVSGRVSFVSPVVDAASALVELRVLLPNPDRRIRPGIKARLQLETRP